GGTVDLGEPEAVHGTFEGFGTGDVIDLPSLGIDGSQFANGTLTLTAGQVVVADLIFSGTSLTASNFQLSPEGVSIAWQPSCYAAGTRILTPRGEVPVDALRPGEAVVTIDPHGARRIDIVRWIGRRQLDLSTHPDPDLAAPVRLRAGRTDTRPAALARSLRADGRPPDPRLAAHQRRFGRAGLSVHDHVLARGA